MARFPLFSRLPKFEELSNDLILDRFLDWATEKGLELYPAQEEAVLALFEGKNVILNTPTGSGKSLVALALHFHSLAMGKRSVYTCPIKALVNEKFLALAKEFGPDQVGMVTGDGAVNRDAPILCCTAEILANIALGEGANAKVDDVIMDEFHYYSDRERGGAWQVPLLTLPQSRFLLMSATLGDMDFFRDELNQLTQRDTEIISRAERPVPLVHEYRETPLHETIQHLLTVGSAPVYLVCFTQREAAEQAQNLMSVDFATKEQKKSITEALHGTDFSSPYGKEIQKFLKHGIGLHHAGLLPKYRVLVERLAQTGLLKVICGTDTLGVGVNIPIRTVLFTKMCKFDGEKTGILSTRDFHQIAGRAGRKGFDNEGRVVVQAPEYVIENKKLEAKAKADPKKAKKLVRAKPPEKGFVNWDEGTFKRLVGGKPEALQSRFEVTHGMLLNVLSRENEDGCQVLRELIRKSHESPERKKKARGRAWDLFRALHDRKIVEIIPDAQRGQKRVRVNVSLQEDFSLNNTLSLYLIDTLAKLDPYSETYARDLLTLVESILESPDLILRKQLDRVKTRRMAEMKMEGIEYDQRIEELEKLEHPKPLRDFIYESFNEFSDKHPWVGTENIRPKSIAREMYETFQSFAEYVREYELQRAEGLLLRYLSDVYRALVQTVPVQSKNEEIDRIIEYFGTIVRSVDSSLIDEWERIRSGETGPRRAPSGASALDDKPAGAEANPLADQRAMRIKIGNVVFRFLRTLAIGEFEESVAMLRSWSVSALVESGDASGVSEEPVDDEGRPWTLARFQDVSKAFGESGHTGILTTPLARGARLLTVVPGAEEWRIHQTISDPEDLNDWQLDITMLTNPVRLRLNSIG